jgi:hypothetical protein
LILLVTSPQATIPFLSGFRYENENLDPQPIINIFASGFWGLHGKFSDLIYYFANFSHAFFESSVNKMFET